jgi:hypothetical protein
VNRTGHYKLAKQSGGLGFFAEVRVTLSDRPNAGIAVADSAFAWLKEDYRANAWEWAECDAFRAGAIRGANFALDHALTPAPMVGVTIELIRAAPADTTAACVAYATCFAVWDALNDSGDGLVQILGRDIFFAGRRLVPRTALPSPAESDPQLWPRATPDISAIVVAAHSLATGAGVPTVADAEVVEHLEEILFRRKHWEAHLAGLTLQGEVVLLVLQHLLTLTGAERVLGATPEAASLVEATRSAIEAALFTDTPEGHALK